MAVTFPGRVEALYTLPSSADVTLTPANYSSGQTVSLAAGSYFHTAAGSVSGGLATWQTALNAAVNGYARTAASAATMLGYGDFTGGAAWSFDIASGNDAGLFGGVTMTASGTPVYGNTGPASAGDKAISFDANTEYFSAGDVYDVTGTDDLLAVFVAKWTEIPPDIGGTNACFGRQSAATTGWALAGRHFGAATAYRALLNSTVLDLAEFLPGEWHVGIIAIDRAAGTARFGIKSLETGTTALTSSASVTSTSYTAASTFRVGATGGLPAWTDVWQCSALYVATGSGAAAGVPANLSTALTNFANAINSSYTVSLSSTDGRVTIANSFWDYSLTWTSTTLRDLIGFDADIASVQTATGAAQAKGVWLPNAPLTCDQHPSMVPVDTDARSSESPTKVLLTLVGNEGYVHNNVGWMRVPVDRIRERSATYANASLEVFWRDCIVGLGDISWFSPGSDLQIWWNNQGTLTLLGDDGVDADGSGVDGWRPAALPRFAELAKPSQPNWVGQWDVRIPRLVSDG